jgi:hypothetical protein
VASSNLAPTVVLQQALSVWCAHLQSPRTACRTLSISWHTLILNFWIALWWRPLGRRRVCQPWPHFRDSGSLRLFIINWTLSSLAHLACCAHDIPAPFAQYWSVISIHHFSKMQIEIVVCRSAKLGAHNHKRLWTVFTHAQFAFHALPCHSSVHRPFHVLMHFQSQTSRSWAACIPMHSTHGLATIVSTKM